MLNGPNVPWRAPLTPPFLHASPLRQVVPPLGSGSSLQVMPAAQVLLPGAVPAAPVVMGLPQPTLVQPEQPRLNRAMSKEAVLAPRSLGSRSGMLEAPGGPASWRPNLSQPLEVEPSLARAMSFAPELVPRSLGGVSFEAPKATSSRSGHRRPLIAEAMAESHGELPRRELPFGGPKEATPRMEGRAKVPPLKVTSLTKPPPQLPAKLSAEYEEDCAEHLGEGAFAIVRSLRRKRDGLPVALKVVEKYPLHIRNMLPQLQREVRIQGSLQHRHILRLLSCMEDEWYLYMLLEHCSGGSLRDLCARQPDCRISEAKASWYFAQILQGVDFMHQNRCLHRDLKEENMLLTADDEVRICDFGWSAEVQLDKALRTTCGTPHYWPPEIFEGLPQDTAVDLWALGTLIYELLVGHAPFWGSVEEIRQKVLSVDIRYPPQLLSPEAVQLFHLLLRRDPHSRIPARQLLQENGWVKKGLDAFKAAGRAEPAASPSTLSGHRCLGASMVDTTLSRQKEVTFEEILRSSSRPLSTPVVAPQISQPLTTPCAVPLSAALPNPMAAMQASAASSVLLKPRPLQVFVPGTTSSQVSLCGAVASPSLCFLGTAR